MTSGQRCVGLATVLAMVVAVGAAGSSQAQIVRDGTVGPAGPLTGPNYTIAYTDGTRAGGNRACQEFRVRASGFI